MPQHKPILIQGIILECIATYSQLQQSQNGQAYLTADLRGHVMAF